MGKRRLREWMLFLLVLPELVLKALDQGQKASEESGKASQGRFDLSAELGQWARPGTAAAAEGLAWAKAWRLCYPQGAAV